MLTTTREWPPDGVLVLRLRGELDAYTVHRFRDAVATLEPTSRVVIDTSALVFVDSAGLGALIGGIRRVRHGGGAVALACDRPALLRLLHTTGFDEVVAIAPTATEATELLALRGATPAAGPPTRLAG